jgi:hypothetical protein
MALLDHISANFQVMVDSSKTAWGSELMPFRLHRNLDGNFLLVHIVRDPRAVCWSTVRSVRGQKTPGGEFARPLRSVLGWLAANLACEIFGLLHSKRYIRVRYEDLVRTPQTVLEPIFGRVGLQPASLDHLGASDNRRHQLHGNKMRRKPLSLADLKEDVAWKTEMPRLHRWLAAGLSWPLLARYRYFRKRPKVRHWT